MIKEATAGVELSDRFCRVTEMSTVGLSDVLSNSIELIPCDFRAQIRTSNWN
jgi:hypothetical protein